MNRANVCNLDEWNRIYIQIHLFDLVKFRINMTCLADEGEACDHHIL